MRVAFLAALVGAALVRPAPIAAQQTPSALPTEAGGGAFSAVIEVDDDGLVVEYEGFWQRARETR